VAISYKRWLKSDAALITFFYIFVIFFSIMCLYPLLLAFSSAFSDEATVTAKGFSLWPRNFTLNTFRFMLSQRLNMVILGYRTSVIVTVLGTLVSVIITTMYAFVISIPGFRHSNKFSFFAYFTMLFNGGML